MKKFNYKAKNEKGKTVKGVVEARDSQAAVKLLKSKGLFVINVKVQKKGSFLKLGLWQKISFDEKVNFTRQFSTMIGSGLPLTEALSILENQFSPKMRTVIGEIINKVQGGQTLAESMAEHKQVFDPVYIALVKAGEAAGILDRILKRLAKNLEKQRNLLGKIKAAMIYPAIIIAGMFGVGLIMVIFVIPRLSTLYEEFQAELPLPTRILLGISGLVSRYWWLGLILAVALFLAGRTIFRLPEIKSRLDSFYFQIPVFGKLRRQMTLAEFSRVLGLLIGSGILVVDALEITQNSMGSLVYRRAIKKTSRLIRKGFPFTYALAQAEAFPTLFVQMINVGEETGKIDELLGRVSRHYDEQVAVTVKGLTSALEPFIMIVLALGVAFLVIAVIMPIYNLTSQF